LKGQLNEINNLAHGFLESGGGQTAKLAERRPRWSEHWPRYERGPLQAGSSRSEATSIGQFIGLNTNIVRLRIFGEPHGKHMRLPEEKSFGNAVHAIHDATVSREDDWERQIGLVDQAGVLYNRATCSLCATAAEPVRLIEFANSLKRHKRRRDS
jgi:hypothetical protein